MLDLRDDSTSTFRDAIDETRIGALGVSLGGLTTLLVSFHPDLQDDRIRVVMPIAPYNWMLTSEFYHRRPLPTLFVGGELDAVATYEVNARRGFERALPNAHLLTVRQASHSGFAEGNDAAMNALLNLLVGIPGADLSNPDGVPCGLYSQYFSGEFLGMPDTLGGLVKYVDTSDASNRPVDRVIARERSAS